MMVCNLAVQLVAMLYESEFPMAVHSLSTLFKNTLSAISCTSDSSKCTNELFPIRSGAFISFSSLSFAVCFESGIASVCLGCKTRLTETLPCWHLRNRYSP